MKFTVFFTSFASVAAAICHYDTTLSPRADLSRRSEGAFGYHELNGPLNWHNLSPDNSICADGKNQSPINVITGEQTTVSGSSLKFKSPKLRRGAEIQNLGSTIQIFVDGSATIGKKVHNLKQFHFHTPSEHHLDNEYFPAEVHFVFQSDDEALAVVGFFIEIAAGSDQTSPLLEAALRNVASIPNAGDKGRTAGLDFSNIKTHLSGSDVFQYSGSLTTPPCKEGVTFNIVASPLYVSAATFRATKDILKFNSRYTQNKPGQINLLDNVRIDIDT